MPDRELKILLIEHDPAFTRYMGEMLGQARDLCIQVWPVATLRAGLLAVREGGYEAVLLDVAVTDGAGLANISLMRSLVPQVALIAVGEGDDDIIAIEAVQAGAQDYLVKGQLTSNWLERSIRYAVERTRMELALVAAEEKYHLLFDHLVEGIYRTTPEGYHLLANAALARIYGFESPEEVIRELTDIGRRLYVVEGRRDEFIRLMQEHDTLSGFESQVYRKDGSIIWISENCRAVRDEVGTLLYYEGTVEDVTLRREAEERLRESESLYHSLVETLPQHIFRKDLDGRFTFANQQFCRSLGRTLDEIRGKTDFDFFPKELATKYQADDLRVVQTGKPYETVEEHQPPGRMKIYVQVVKTPLVGAGGKMIGLQGIFWDITHERMAAEKIRRTNALLAQSRKELRIKNLEMEDDLKMAREIQLTMLPQQHPVFPRAAGSSETVFQFTHRYLPTGSVGGDFFMIWALSECEAAVFVCDVAGHGVRSALVTAMIRALVEELRPVANEPGRFLTKLNSDLFSILKHVGTPMLTTAFYLVANWREGKMRFANAGHPKPLVVRRRVGRVEPLVNVSGRSQAALGLFEEASYQTSEAALGVLDLVMLYTDGLYEVQNKDGELYTQGLLLRDVERRMGLPATELFDQVINEVREFSGDGRFSDDVCLVGLEVNG